jgi:hypothetical protein
MSWVGFKVATSKIWLWLKEHWQVPFLLAWTIIVYILTRRNSQAAIDVLAAKRESYDKQIKELNLRHKNEIIERDKLIHQYHETVRKIEERYKEKEKLLSNKEKKRVKEIIKKSKGEPDVVKKEIEKSFGFTYVD